MDHFDMVEKLREKAKVSYEEAKAALEKTDWNLLDAIVLLENHGQLKEEEAFHYSTKQEEKTKKKSDERESVRGFFSRAFAAIGKLIAKGNRIFFVISRKEEALIELPMTAVAIVLLLCFYCIPALLIILAIGLFFGFRYHVKGEGVGDAVNRVMDKAAQTAENLKYSVADEPKDEGKEDRPF